MILIRLYYFLKKIYLLKYLKNKGVEIGVSAQIVNKPIITKVKSAKIIIGDNVTINSRNEGYHLNMHSPCKLVADKPEAVIIIGNNTRVHGTCIHAYKKITIGNNCLIAANTQIIDANGHLTSFSDVKNRINTQDEGRSITIEDNVWIGANCIILPGVTIGEGSIISANSVVNTDIPPMSVAGGNYAVVIKKIEK